VPPGSPARRDPGWAHGAGAVGWCSALRPTVRPGLAVKPGSANSSRGLGRAPCPSWRALHGAPSARAADSAPLVLPTLTGASAPGGHTGEELGAQAARGVQKGRGVSGPGGGRGVGVGEERAF
jgi:hypothetical protein